MLPEAGGEYVYARRAYGDYRGFVVGWSISSLFFRIIER